MDRENHRRNLEGHVVILNVNDKVGTIIDELRMGSNRKGIHIVLVVQDATLWEENPEWRPSIECEHSELEIIVGYPTDPEILQRAGVDRAKAAVILADPKHGDMADAPSTLTALAIEKQNPKIHTVMELLLSVNRAHLEATEVNEVICFGEISENLIAQSCISPGVKNIFERLLTAEEGAPHLFVSELPKSLYRKTFRQLFRKAVENSAPFIIVGYIIDRENDSVKQTRDIYHPICNWKRSDFIINPKSGTRKGKDTPLAKGCRLVVLGYTKPEISKYLFEETIGPKSIVCG